MEKIPSSKGSRTFGLKDKGWTFGKRLRNPAMNAANLYHVQSIVYIPPYVKQRIQLCCEGGVTVVGWRCCNLIELLHTLLEKIFISNQNVRVVGDDCLQNGYLIQYSLIIKRFSDLKFIDCEQIGAPWQAVNSLGEVNCLHALLRSLNVVRIYALIFHSCKFLWAIRPLLSHGLFSSHCIALCCMIPNQVDLVNQLVTIKLQPVLIFDPLHHFHLHRLKGQMVETREWASFVQYCRKRTEMTGCKNLLPLTKRPHNDRFLFLPI